MVRRVVHQLIDDLDGKAAEETVVFGLDGVQYEIDLSGRNAARLRAVFAPFIEAGTRLGRSAPPRRAGGRGAGRAATGAARGPVDADQNQAIRAWAQARGLQVSGRGRIRQDVIDRYHREAGR